MKGLILLVILTSCAMTISSQKFICKTSIDLNSDKENDSILVKNGKDDYEFELQINGEVKVGKFEDGHTNGFIIIDLDKSDNHMEVAVHTPGPSNDDEYMIYSYYENTIIFISHLSGCPEFIGNGIVYVNNWEGFWSSRDEYKFDKSTRILNQVEQFAYFVGVKTTITKGFEIFREKELKSKVAMLSDNSNIELILCDKKNKDPFKYSYLIKSEDNLLGWANFKTISNSAKLSMTD